MSLMSLRPGASPLEVARRAEGAEVPSVLRWEGGRLRFEEKEALGAAGDHDAIKERFPRTYGAPRVALCLPETGDGTAGRGRQEQQQQQQQQQQRPLRIGCVLSGGQAAGGHSVITGLFQRAKALHPGSTIVGFQGGPRGLLQNDALEITQEQVDIFHNTGGFDWLHSGRDKIETDAQFVDALRVTREQRLDGLVVIGGDDSNTNAALLAEYFLQNDCACKVVGVPKTIDGDLRNQFIPISFGFDTACKTYAQLVGNLCIDGLASQKYWHFVRLMGRAASNIVLETAMLTRPNVCLISEEVLEENQSLEDICRYLTDVIVRRAAQGKNYGVVLLPEGLIEFVPEFSRLIDELNDIMAEQPAAGSSGAVLDEAAIAAQLSTTNRMVFSFVPPTIRRQLLLDRDPHGNVQVAKIETEKLLALTVQDRLRQLAGKGEYSGSFKPQFHAFGYEGRAGLPSRFDSNYCHALGRTAVGLIENDLTGLMCSITNLAAPVDEWVCGGCPITMMLHLERRKGKLKPVIKKALVELDQVPFRTFAAQRHLWQENDLYRSPGPLQFYAPTHRSATTGGGSEENKTEEEEEEAAASASAERVIDRPPITLELELGQPCDRVELPETVEQMAAGERKGAFVVAATPDALKADLQISRRGFQPPLAPALRGLSVGSVRIEAEQPTQCPRAKDRPFLRQLFANTFGNDLLELHNVSEQPAGKEQDAGADGARELARLLSVEDAQPVDDLPSVIKIGVVFCGRQSPGGANVVAGAFDALQAHAPASQLLGFVGGTEGLFAQEYITLTQAVVDSFRNQGGYQMLCRSVNRINTKEDLAATLAACTDLALDGLVLVGGTRTNTDAAYLAEHLIQHGCRTAVVGVPVTIDADMKNNFVETSVGFDTACKVDAEVIGNTATDAASARKYWYLLRVAGTASHVALEATLQTKPNISFVAEEVRQNNRTLGDIVSAIADVVQERAENGHNYGVAIIPEGLILAMPEIALLVDELNQLFQANLIRGNEDIDQIGQHLTTWSHALLKYLPVFIQRELLLERQSNRGIQLSQIETERLLAHLVQAELARRADKGEYHGKFSYVCQFVGYQARGAMPSDFDATLAYNLGVASAAIAARGFTGYLANVTHLKEPVDNWEVGAVPLTCMLENDGHGISVVDKTPRPRIPPAWVDLSSPAFVEFQNNAKRFAIEDHYSNPGPVQYWGPAAQRITRTLELENHQYLQQIRELQVALAAIRAVCRPGVSDVLLDVATRQLNTLTDLVRIVHREEDKREGVASIVHHIPTAQLTRSAAAAAAHTPSMHSLGFSSRRRRIESVVDALLFDDEVGTVLTAVRNAAESGNGQAS